MNKIWIGMLTCMALVALAAGAADSAGQPDFSGSWRINQFMSEDPMEKMRESMQERMRSAGMGSKGGGMGGMGGGSGGGMGRGGGMGSKGGGMGGRPDPEAMQQRIRDLNLSADHIEIMHEEPLLTIRYADGRERRLYTDGREQQADTKVKWKKRGKLVVNSTTELGRHITERYELAMEGRQLLLVTSIDGDDRAPSFKFTRVYDRVAYETTEPE
jgi:hypothetical protein